MPPVWSREPENGSRPPQPPACGITGTREGNRIRGSHCIPLLWLLAAWGQSQLEPASGAGQRAVDMLRRVNEPGTPPLACSIWPVKPFLSYGLVYWSGFEAAIPVAELASSARRSLAVVLRLTPEGGVPVLLAQRHALPRPPPSPPLPALRRARSSWHFNGGFLVGAGRYKVEWAATADGRGCTKTWRIEVPKGKTPGRLAPGIVSGLDAGGWQGPAPGGKGRVTVMLHATPVTRRRYLARLSQYDRSVLLNVLTSLLDNGRYAEVRLVAFDLDRRRILYEIDRFGAAEYLALGRVLEEAEYATIGYQTLAAGPRRPDYMQDLMAQEAARAPEALIVAGPSLSWGEKGNRPPASLRESLPPLHYIALTRIGATPKDTVEQVVGSLGGKTYAVYQPADLRKALSGIAASIERRGAARVPGASSSSR